MDPFALEKYLISGDDPISRYNKRRESERSKIKEETERIKNLHSSEITDYIPNIKTFLQSTINKYTRLNPDLPFNPKFNISSNNFGSNIEMSIFNDKSILNNNSEKYNPNAVRVFNMIHKDIKNYILIKNQSKWSNVEISSYASLKNGNISIIIK